MHVGPAVATGLLGAGLIGLAGVLDAEPLYVPGIAFVALAVAAVAWVIGAAPGVRLTRTIDLRRVVEDEPVQIALTIRGSRPLPPGVLHDDLLDRPASLAAGRRRTDVTLVARFGRRGRKRLAAPRVALRDPFGLVTRVVQGAVPDAELLVLPRTHAVTAPDGRGEPLSAGHLRVGRPAAAAEVELDGIRQHRPGTPASRIYWPALARRGELLERRMTAEGDTRPLIVLDARGAASTEDEDAAVRAAASLAVHLARRGGCALLIPGDRHLHQLDGSLQHWPHVHARLALVTGRQAPALSGVAGRRGDVLYVSARRLARPPRVLTHGPSGGRLLVVPGAPDGRRASFAVAGCIGYLLSGTRGARAVA